ncbi:hypothetical protein HAX54_014368, partial [Datura stramonium]|nr:hypothetical protein [Datura stramonium]
EVARTQRLRRKTLLGIDSTKAWRPGLPMVNYENLDEKIHEKGWKRTSRTANIVPMQRARDRCSGAQSTKKP